MSKDLKKKLGFSVWSLVGAVAEDLKIFAATGGDPVSAAEIRGMLRALSCVVPWDRCDRYGKTKAEVFAFLRGGVDARVADRFGLLREDYIQRVLNYSEKADTAAMEKKRAERGSEVSA